jgi:SAM-dependent methyltransferase
VADIGCGPGAASLDLADVVGPSGRVIAVDQSQRFLDIVLQRARANRVRHIHVQQANLNEWRPQVPLQGAWCRWVLSFLREPQRLVAGLGQCALPGARIVVHEYYDYAAWKMHPRVPEQEVFVRTVMQSWRDSGGEPDIALSLPRLLSNAGFHVVEQRPIAQVLTADDHAWSWLAGFIKSGASRLASLSYLTDAEADNILQTFEAAAQTPGVQMIAPSVLEIIAVKRNR